MLQNKIRHLIKSAQFSDELSCSYDWKVEKLQVLSIHFLMIPMVVGRRKVAAGVEVRRGYEEYVHEVDC